ncbi:MAG: galactose mutarotase [Prevotella sp.]|nr:galactose mutarotase [Prevotella sp.]
MCSLSVLGSDKERLETQGTDEVAQVPTRSGLRPDRFVTTVDGKQTALYTLTNNGMEACITNYGARVVSLMVPDQEGRLGDVVLGFDNINDYINKKQNFGSVVGRYAGRIRGARFALDGVPYMLQQTGGGNIAHGGRPGFSDRVWDMVAATDSTLRLRYVSPDGENGFPGTLTVTVTYTLTYDHALTVSFEGTTDKPTVVNLTCHPFFNISGDPSSTVLTQTLYVDSKYIATYDKEKNVDGKFMKVKNTPFDFTTAKAIGADIDIMDEQMGITKGYDHGFALRHAGDITRRAAVVYDAKSGRRLTVFTTEPSVLVYTANGLDGSMVGKNGIALGRHSAICLEPMHFSDSPNQPDFPSTTLRPGETYYSFTIYHFSDKESHKQRNLLSTILMYGGVASLTGLGIIGLVSVLK